MKDLLLKHKGAFVGGLVGLIVALLILIIGFWKALVVLLLMGIGVIIGMAIDGNTTIKDSMDKFKSNK